MKCTLVDIVKWAVECHAATNHQYASHPYSFHLQSVQIAMVKVVRECEERGIRTFTSEELELLYASAWCHDLIEDARVTYNDIITKTGSRDLAEIVWSVTQDAGRNRKERQSPAYYTRLAANPNAVLVKMADRIANMQFSKTSGSGMYQKYLKELPEFFEKSKMSEALREIFMKILNT